MTKEQERAICRLDRLLEKRSDNINRNLNIHILLDIDPREQPTDGELFDDSFIKKLIRIGADVRFTEKESKMKLVLQENELYLSFSNDVFRMVSVGYHYIGKNNADGMCRYFANEFDKQFERTHKLTVKEDKIVVDNAYIGEQVKHAFHLKARSGQYMF